MAVCCKSLSNHCYRQFGGLGLVSFDFSNISVATVDRHIHTLVKSLPVCAAVAKKQSVDATTTLSLSSSTSSRSSRRFFGNNLANETSEKGSEKNCAITVPQRNKLPNGPQFKQFVQNVDGLSKFRKSVTRSIQDDHYLGWSPNHGRGRKVYFETYGCQMNVNDTDIAWAILEASHYQRTTDVGDADIVLLMTCAIREGAESKIWRRLRHLKTIRNRRQKTGKNGPMKIGVLGCMAERLKADLLEKERLVDVVCGPDAYRDLPRLLAVTSGGQSAMNVQLSLEETYADVVPVRINHDSPSAYVSIMRGCDNMCTYCIVPFTRGRERSRPISSILDEVRFLSDQGVKEVILLGQNVNSYRDTSDSSHNAVSPAPGQSTSLRPGFQTVYRPKKGGKRFSELLDKVSLINPEMRIRFTSPHPKDFPDEVLQLIQERPNICKQLHIPAQSGNNQTLTAMGRGYTRESYLQLIDQVRHILPDVALSSDFIAGFCGETEEAHKDTLSLIKYVQYNFAFCFPYSMRQKTRAHHRLSDDVPVVVKARRHNELIEEFRAGADRLNRALIGQQQLVLIEGESKKSSLDLAGRNDGNTKVILPKVELPHFDCQDVLHIPEPGDYVAVQISSGGSQTLKGIPLYLTTLQSFHRQRSRSDWCSSLTEDIIYNAMPL